MRPKSGLLIKCIQWGSEVRTCLGFEWSKRGMFTKGPDFEWDLKSVTPTIWNQDKRPSFYQKPFKIWKKCPDLEWSGFWIAGTIAIAKARLWKLDHSKSNLPKRAEINAHSNCKIKWNIPLLTMTHWSVVQFKLWLFIS